MQPSSTGSWMTMTQVASHHGHSVGCPVQRRPAQPPFPRAGGEWRLKYERAVREIDFTKKRLQQELEDKLEVEQQGKRQLERRVSAAPHCGPHRAPMTTLQR